jgi:hypothetical protein
VLVVVGRLVLHSDDRVQVRDVVSAEDPPEQVDERLLSLTAGIEAVAMRRPTEIR